MKIRSLLYRNRLMVVILFVVLIAIQFFFYRVQDKYIAEKEVADQINHEMTELIMLSRLALQPSPAGRVYKQWNIQLNKVHSLIARHALLGSDVNEELETLEDAFRKLLQIRQQEQQPAVDTAVLRKQELRYQLYNSNFQTSSRAIITLAMSISRDSMRSLQMSHRQNLLVMLAYIILVIIFFVANTRLVVKRISSAQEALGKGIKKIEKGNLDFRFELSSNQSPVVKTHDTRKVAEAINDMVSQIKENISQLNERNAFIETIQNNIPVGLAVNYQDKGELIYMNEEFAKIYGWPEEQLKNVDSFFMKVYPDERYRKKMREKIAADINSGNLSRMQWNGIEITTQSGEKKYIYAKNIPLPAQNLMISTVMDITDRIKNEKEIEDYQKKLKHLSTEIVLIEERQRKAIAANIHDNLSQSLVISKMRLNELLNQISQKQWADEVRTVVNLVSEALENSRKITYDLSPPVLYELGLVEALEWLAEKMEREYELEVGFQSEIEHIMLPDSRLILVYRAVQEVLNNVVKHAHATKVNLQIMKEDHKRFMICVKDNGVGFDKHKATGKSMTGGFGLFAVKERIENLSGALEIISVKEKGTKVKIFIPLNKS